MGVSDSLTGIISSLISLSFVFQLAAIPLAQSLKNTKKASIYLTTIAQLLFTSLYIIPFLNLGRQLNTTLVITLLMVAYFAHYVILGTVFKWCNSFVDPEKRGAFTSFKEMVSLFTGMIFTLVVGKVFDYYEAIGQINNGFIFIAITMIVLSTLNLISLIMVQKEDIPKQETKPIKEVIGNIMKNKSYIYVVIMIVIWDVARFLTIGFLGTFKTQELMLSVGAVQIINIVSNLCRMGISIPFGKYSDKYSYVKGMKLGYLIAAAAFLINAFTTERTWWFIIIYTVLMAVSSAGTVANNFNIMYSYVPTQYYVQANAIKSSIAGLCGFGASLVGSKILNYVQANGNTLFGIHIYGQQVLSFISFVLIILLVVFVSLTLEKQKTMVQ